MFWSSIKKRWLADKKKEAALDVANRIRSELGYKPVEALYPGQRAVGNNCPITNTIYDNDIDRIQLKIETHRYGVIVFNKNDGSTLALPLSDLAQKFVDGFDSGYYPELDEDEIK